MQQKLIMEITKKPNKPFIEKYKLYRRLQRKKSFFRVNDASE